MRTVRVIYRKEPDGAWIGTSPEVPGFLGHGNSYEEARDRVNDGLGWFAEENLLIAHFRPEQGDLAEGQATRGSRVTFAITGPPKRPAKYGHRFREVTGAPEK